MKWMPLLPEIYFFLVAAVFFVLALLSRSNPRRDYLAALVLAAGGVAVSLGSSGWKAYSFSQVFRVDLFSQVFKVLLAAGVLSHRLPLLRTERHRGAPPPEFYFLLTLCTLAMMMLVSSVELLTIYVALELVELFALPVGPVAEGGWPSSGSGPKIFPDRGVYLGRDAFRPGLPLTALTDHLCSGTRPGASRADGLAPGLHRPAFYPERIFLQAGPFSFSFLGARCLSGGGQPGDGLHRHRDQGGGHRHPHAPGVAAAATAPIWSTSWWCWPLLHDPGQPGGHGSKGP